MKKKLQNVVRGLQSWSQKYGQFLQLCEAYSVVSVKTFGVCVDEL